MPTVLFIHGMFMNSLCWEYWVPYFVKQKYTCKAPDWQYHKGKPEKLRQTIHPALGTLQLHDVVNQFREIILSLSEKPVLIGHSMGGLVAQLLVAKGFAQAAVLIDSAPPAGIISFTFSFLKSNFPTINPLKGNSPNSMTIPRFHYTFCNTMTLEETIAAYERYVIPESRNVPRSSIGQDGKIDFTKPHVPLLFIAGEKDNIIPASLNKTNAEKYSNPKSKVTYKVFPGRSHFICGQTGWQEVADYVLDWLKRNSLIF